MTVWKQRDNVRGQIQLNLQLPSTLRSFIVSFSGLEIVLQYV